MVRDRLIEQAEDKGVDVSLLLGDDAPSVIKTVLKKYMEVENYNGGYNTQLFIAMSLHTSLDYFVCTDYSDITTVYCQTPEGKTTRVANQTLIQFLSCYLRLSPDRQKKVYQQQIKNMIMS